MSCECASEAIECMPLPGVADLCCPASAGCCKPRLSLAIIEATNPGITAVFDETGTVPEGTPVSHLAMLQQYADAIEASAELLASRVCMARYAAECCVCTTICAPQTCTCTCNCCAICERESIRIDKASKCFARNRVESVTVDGQPASLNGDNPDATYLVAWCGSGWRLYGVETGCGGKRVEICFTLKPATAMWRQATLDMACSRVPCQHAASCSTEDDRAYYLALRSSNVITGRPALTGLPSVDDLVAECCTAGWRIGTGSKSETVRWAACPEPELVEPI